MIEGRHTSKNPASILMQTVSHYYGIDGKVFFRLFLLKFDSGYYFILGQLVHL